MRCVITKEGYRPGLKKKKKTPILEMDITQNIQNKIPNFVGFKNKSPSSLSRTKQTETASPLFFPVQIFSSSQIKP